jgi:hypothetical protein
MGEKLKRSNNLVANFIQPRDKTRRRGAITNFLAVACFAEAGRENSTSKSAGMSKSSVILTVSVFVLYVLRICFCSSVTNISTLCVLETSVEAIVWFHFAPPEIETAEINVRQVNITVYWLRSITQYSSLAALITILVAEHAAKRANPADRRDE